MQENSDFFAIFSLEDARVASYSLEMRGEETAIYASLHKWQGIIYKLIILLRVSVVFQKMAVLLQRACHHLLWDKHTLIFCNHGRTK